RFLTSIRQDSCHRRHSLNPMNRHRFRAYRAKAFNFSAAFKGTIAQNVGSIFHCLVLSYLPIRPYAVPNTGGCEGRISANATWMMPPASPNATPIRHAMEQEPSASDSTPPPQAPKKVPIVCLTNAIPL